jgi:hypothetical protein
MIDTTKLPTFKFDLSAYLTASTIKRDMRNINVKNYVYAFFHKETLMKYGVQYDCDNDTFGERIYRQAFHIPGWPSVPSKKSAGNDILDIICYFPNINKNDITIQVWDMTNYPRANSNNPKFEVNQVERQFIKEYIKLHGSRPIGNIKDERHMDNKAFVPDVMFNNLFEVIN